MKTLLTLAIAMLSLSLFATAQSPYVLTATTGAYVPLTTGTSVNGNAMWDTQFFTMPVGFNVKIGSHIVNRVFTDGTDMYTDTTGTSVDLFQSFYAHSSDRGTTVSRSPLRYATTGTTPNRIFKYEVSGGGFFVEKQMYGSYNDSFSVQFWVYETSNVVEVHFGPSKISHAVDYFGTTGLPAFTGYFNVNFTTGMPVAGYFAAGPLATPFMDSVTATHNPLPLNSYPSSGTVFRFTPITNTTGVATTNTAMKAMVYPTITNDFLRVNLTEDNDVSYEVISLNGSVVTRGNLKKGLNTVAVDELPIGSFLMQLKSTDKIASYQFIKQ